MSSSAQLMRQAETAKAALTDPSKVLSDLWGQRQKLEDLYKQLLLHDLEYALDKKVEQDLWNHAFKNQISTLQNQAKDKVSLKKMEARANLNLFLEMASGFYLQFLQMICSTFKLDLPFRRRSSVFGITNENRIHDTNIVLPKKTSCLYICCHCLVHLGDIARYLQQTEQAQNYYRHAANLSPNNGQPYNQLAILEASRGDRLSTVFYYIRSLAVRHPFTVAATNLEKLYAKLIKDARDFDNPNLSVSEITVAFLHFQALLHSATNLDRAPGLRNNIASSLASHIKSQTLTAAHLKGIVAISIFALHRARNDTTVPGEPVKKAMLSEEEQRCVELHISFFAKLLETLLQHTPKEDSKVKDFLTLPTIKVCFDWLSLNRDVLKLREFNNTSLWQDICKLLNNIQWLLNDNSKVPDPEKYVEMPLPEDMDLRCFQPLDATYGLFNYARAEKEEMSAGCERDLRCHRLVAHGKWIAHDLPTLKLIVFQPERSIRTQFSSQKIASQIEGLQATPAKSSRHNVAMQTILKKQMEKKAEEDKNATIATPDGKAKSGNVARVDTSNVSGGASTGNGGRSGVIPVQHHKGGTFKANLPPRLSAKTKSQPSVSPRLQKKDDNNSNNFFTSLPSSSPMASKTITTAASMSKQQQPQPPPPPPPVLDSEVEYPSLGTGVGGRKPVGLGVAASPLALPGQSPVGSNGSNAIASSNSASSSSGGMSKYTWGPALSTVVGGSPVNAMEHDPAKDARGVVSSGGMVVGVENLPPASSFGAAAFSGLYSTSQPPHRAHQSNSRLSSPYSNNNAMEGITSSSSINSNRPKGSHLQEDSISKIGLQAPKSSSGNSGNPIPGYAPFSLQGPTSMQQPQSLFQSSTANSNNGTLAHPHLQQQQQQQMKLNNLFKQQQQQQFPRYPISQVMSSTDYYSTAPPSQPQQQQHAGLKMYEPKPQQQQQQQHIFGNSVAAGRVSPTSLHHQDQNSGDLGLFSTSGVAGTLQPSSYNPHSYQNQKQRQQQQQQLDNHDPNDSSKALSGLLYKNIPMPGSASRMTTSQHQMPQQQQQQQQQQRPQPNPALAQLMALNRTGGSSTSTLSSSPSSSSQSDFFRSNGAGYRALTKPDLMGLQPPPSFLEQHHQDRSYNKMSGGHPHQHQHHPLPHHHQQHHQHPHHHHHNQQQQQHHHQQQQPSFLNTVMDPSFLQATGEYSLFNNNNNNNNMGGGVGSGSGSGNTSGNTGVGWPPVSVSAKPSHGSMPSGVKGPAPSTPSAFTVQGELNPSLQALWQSTGPSPLERLLEQQRHQRHNDG